MNQKSPPTIFRNFVQAIAWLHSLGFQPSCHHHVALIVFYRLTSADMCWSFIEVQNHRNKKIEKAQKMLCSLLFIENQAFDGCELQCRCFPNVSFRSRPADPSGLQPLLPNDPRLYAFACGSHGRGAASDFDDFSSRIIAKLLSSSREGIVAGVPSRTSMARKLVNSVGKAPC